MILSTSRSSCSEIRISSSCSWPAGVVPAEQRVGDRLRLLEDLLAHEPVVAVLLGGREVPVDVVAACPRPATPSKPVTSTPSRVIVTTWSWPSSIASRVCSMNAATSEPRKFSPSPSPTTSGELRRAATTRDGSCGVDGDQREGALAAAGRPAASRRSGRRRASSSRSSRWAATSVSVSERSSMPVGLELGAQLGEVLDDPVVHERDPVVPAEVRVGVAVGRRRRGWPSGCARCRSSTAAAGARRAPSRGWRACRPACRSMIAPSCDQRDAGGVVAAVLQPAQPLDHDVLRLLLADVPHDSAHGPRVYRRRGPARSSGAAGARCNNAAHALRRRRSAPASASRRRTSSSTARRGRRWPQETEPTSRPTRSTRLRGLGDALDLDEVREVYLPLSRLLSLHVRRPGGCTASRRSSSTGRSRRARRS